MSKWASIVSKRKDRVQRAAVLVLTPLTPSRLSCSNIVRYSYKDMNIDMAPFYNPPIDGGYGLKILVYSGDDDSVCALSGTDDWLWNLGYEPVEGKYWKEWVVDQQTAGYVTHFKDGALTYATVHGAGHEVPTYKPKQALVLFENYINGEW